MSDSGRSLAGSKQLGAELRRLRGGRSLACVAALLTSEPFRDRTRPISAATLEQIERGLTLPSLEALRSLALIYRVSSQQLLDCLTREQLGQEIEEPTSMEQARDRFALALQASRWSAQHESASHGSVRARGNGRGWQLSLEQASRSRRNPLHHEA